MHQQSFTHYRIAPSAKIPIPSARKLFLLSTSEVRLPVDIGFVDGHFGIFPSVEVICVNKLKERVAIVAVMLLQEGSDLNKSEIHDGLYWFDSKLDVNEIIEASHHLPQYEFSVTGKKRIKPGTKRSNLGKKISLNGKELALFKFNGVIYALNDACPHQGASLHLGDIEDMDGTLCISCPRHHWPFSLEDGSCLIGVNIQAQLYPTQIRQDHHSGTSTVFIGFTSFCDSLFHHDEF